LKIWSRRSEWDYSWVNQLESPEVILCSIYEHARYALLSLPGNVLFPREENLGAATLAAKSIRGPIWFLGIECPASFVFPHNPYRVARNRAKAFDPQDFLGLLDSLSNPLLYRAVPVYLPSDATRARSGNILATQRECSGSGSVAIPQRGAGARVRRAKASLKALGALKLRSIMSAPEAIEHTAAQRSGLPLFCFESQWSRAQKQARANLVPYQAEAARLWKAFGQPLK
jgi:hypothetical protein